MRDRNQDPWLRGFRVRHRFRCNHCSFCAEKFLPSPFKLLGSTARPHDHFGIFRIRQIAVSFPHGSSRVLGRCRNNEKAGMICTPTRTNLACKAGLKKLQRLPPTTTARLPCTSLEQEPWDELHLLRVNTRAKRLYGINIYIGGV